MYQICIKHARTGTMSVSTVQGQQEAKGQGQAVSRWVLNIDPNPNPEDDQGGAGGSDSANTDPEAAILPSSSPPVHQNPPVLPRNGSNSQDRPYLVNDSALLNGAMLPDSADLGLDQQTAMFSNMIARQMMAMQQQQMQVGNLTLSLTIKAMFRKT